MFEPVYEAPPGYIQGRLQRVRLPTPAEAMIRSLIAAVPGAKIIDQGDWIKTGWAFARLGNSWLLDDRDARLDLWHEFSSKAEGFEDNTGCAEEWERRVLKEAKDRSKPATWRTL